MLLWLINTTRRQSSIVRLHTHTQKENITLVLGIRPGTPSLYIANSKNLNPLGFIWVSSAL